MAKSDSHSLRNTIIGTAVGGAILSAVGYVVFFLPNVLRWILNILARIWNHFVSFTSIPRWLLWLLICLAAATVIRLAKPLLQSRSNEPTVRMYTQDSFEGVTWRWSYGGADNPTQVVPYCPYCDTILVHSESSVWGQTPKVSFYCERCKAVRAEIEGGGRAYAISMIERLIDRNIRNDEWKRLVGRNV
jgi:hypothetical protein